MTPAVGFFVGSACYALSAVFAIRLSDRRSVATAAAFAPALAWWAIYQEHVALLTIPPVLGVIALVIGRRSASNAAWQVVFFVATVILVGALAILGVRGVLLPAIVGGAIYLAGDFLRQRGLHQPRVPEPREDRRTWWLLQGVLLCACGLTGLGVEQLDWPAFAAMAAVLVLTKHEFEAFAQSRKAFEQTIRAVEKLTRRDQEVWSGRSKPQF